MSRVLSVVFSLFLLLPAKTIAGPLSECVRGPVSCTNRATTRTCSATLMCDHPAVQYWAVSATFGPNVSDCQPSLEGRTLATTFTLVALAMTSAPATRTCSWIWSGVSASYLPVSDGVVQITGGDGLPVELMDFAIEDGGSAAAAP